jgi:hypothetical protein
MSDLGVVGGMVINGVIFKKTGFWSFWMYTGFDEVFSTVPGRVTSGA